MDIAAELAKNQSQSQCRRIADYIGEDVGRFRKLVEIFLAGPYRITQRASWPLSVCLETHPSLVMPHLNKILEFTKRNDTHPAVQRNTMRLLQFIDVPKRLHGKVLDLAFEFLQDRKQPIAVRVFSITVIEKLIVDKSDLQRELRILLEDEMPYASAAFRSRGMKVVRRLDRIDRAKTSLTYE
jgi:hypothetical protein